MIFIASPITADLLALLIVVVSPFNPNAVALKCVKQWDDPAWVVPVGTVLALPACTVCSLPPFVCDSLEN